MVLVADVCISYIYDASGVKQQKIVHDVSHSTSSSTMYAGNYLYKSNGQNAPLLTFFNTEEGYIEPVIDNGGGDNKIIDFAYTYQYKDHLGNIRLSYQDMDGDGQIEPSTEIKEENHYYPFGLKHKGYNNQIIRRDHQYGYGYEGQKEEQNELGLNWIDYGARNYDASLGRWFSVDNMAEEFYDMTPYKYGMNNPILYTDPDGNCEICDAFIGFTVAVLDNAFKTNVRDNFNQTPAFVQATKTGDAASVVTGAGAAGMARSIGITVGSGGTATITTGPAFAGSAALAGLGIGEYWLGGNMVMNASGRTYSSSDEGSSSSGNNSQKTGGSQNTDSRTSADPLRKSKKGHASVDPEATGRPQQGHTNLHQHIWEEKPTGGSRKRGKATKIPLRGF